MSQAITLWVWMFLSDPSHGAWLPLREFPNMFDCAVTDAAMTRADTHGYKFKCDTTQPTLAPQ